jgi:hypothetical protein
MQRSWVKGVIVMNSLRYLLVLALLSPVCAVAKVFINEDYGYSIEIADGYQLMRNDDVTYFSAEQDNSIIAIKNWPGLTEEAARDYILQGYQDEKVAIVAAGEPEAIAVEKGKGLLVAVEGIFERKRMKGMSGGFVGDDGQGLVVMFSGPAANWDALADLAKQTTASIKFVDYGGSTINALDWYYMLAGTRLSLRGTVDDSSRHEDLYFCSDGSFKHRLSRSSTKEFDSGSAFGYSTKSKSGLWTVADGDGASRLMLRYSDGREDAAILEDRNGRTFLDGQRYSMMSNNRCR